MGKTSFFLLVWLCSGACSLVAWAQDKDGFVLIKTEGQISIYERWVNFPNAKPAVKAREVKGEFIVNNSIYAALHLVKDESKIKKWQSHVSEFKVYPQPDTTLWYEYSYHDISWPVSDQDHFLIYKLNEIVPGKDLFLMFESKVNLKLAPVRDGVARMGLSGSWRFEKLGNNKTKVTYKIISMPSSIPKFFTDPVIRRNLMNTIKSYVELLEKKQT
jgi:hypothetical protein